MASSSSSSSILLRSIYPKRFALSSSSSYCNLWKRTAISGATCSNRRCVTTAAAAAASDNQYSPPLLMLPPQFEDGATSYKFYSLAENKLLTPNPSPTDIIRNLRLTCRGSSLGWLALLSPYNQDFFLYNPITHRHIKLPSIDNLPRCPGDSKELAKVILSCSPDEDEANCRAVLVDGCSDALAFCCPGRSKEWTLMWDEKRGERCYIDCVYSTRQKLFFGLTYYQELETWDLRDPSSPKLIDVVRVKMYEYHNLSTPERGLCGPGIKEHLVVAKQDHLLLVIQYLMDYVGPDGSCFDHSDERRPEYCPYMTVDFDIFRYDPKKRSFECVDRSYLGGLALFLGLHSHSVAIPTTHFPELKSNSIYFTDIYFTGTLTGDLIDDNPFLGHDIGVFDYGNRTVSPCYYPCDVRSLKKILPAPVWFFPSRAI